MTTSKKSPDMRARISHIPILGYLLRLSWTFIHLPQKQQQLVQNTEATRSELNSGIQDIHKKISALQDDFQTEQEKTGKLRGSTSDQLADIKHQLLLLSSQAGTSTTVKPSDQQKSLLADDHYLDKFYVDFENKFRGTENAIYERLKVYLPYFKALKTDFSQYPVIDIGCGRGEMLKLLGKNKINALGIDLNETMVKRAEELGFSAVQADALEYLAGLEKSSVSAITGFHIVEHIPFNTLLRLFQECYRVLRPGGVMIFETPNPESIHVGSFSFYFDPSHLHPIPPEILAFAAENRGFESVEILRLHPKRDDYDKTTNLRDERLSELTSRFFGPQDYAIIAKKD